jgi:copper chaperone
MLYNISVSKAIRGINMEKVVLKVDGMSCEHCVRAVTNAVTGIAGTEDISVDLKAGTASFAFDSGKTSLDAIAAAIAEEGYTVKR